MIIYILTSDKNNWLIKGMQYCIKKYWHKHPPVKILGYSKLNFKLEKGFEFISLGVDKGPNHVNKDLELFFSKVKDNNFIFTVDDFWPIRKINTEIMKEFENIIETKKIGRIAMNGHVKTKPFNLFKELENFNIIELAQHANYRKSAIWSIWNKDYFIKYLSSTVNLWQWELDEQCKHDGTIILGSDKLYAIQACHLMKRGNIKSDWYKDSESQDIMFEDDIEKVSVLINE